MKVGGVQATVRCPACGVITCEICRVPEHWESDKRHCHKCGHQGLEMMAVPSKPGEWSPDPEAREWSDGE